MDTYTMNRPPTNDEIDYELRLLIEQVNRMERRLSRLEEKTSSSEQIGSGPYGYSGGLYN